MLTDLTWDKTVNKYAPGRPPWTSSHSADTFSVGLVLSSILRRWEALVPSASSLPCRCVSTGSPGDVGWWMSLLSDQVAPAHHNHSQSYRPSYSDTRDFSNSSTECRARGQPWKSAQVSGCALSLPQSLPCNPDPPEGAGPRGGTPPTSQAHSQ